MNRYIIAALAVALMTSLSPKGQAEMNDKPKRPNAPYTSPPPEVIREQGNHLAGEKSEYLQQHAHNPTDWYPWGVAALARAAAEGKPVFLSIGYASCHWCHVMEREVFTHDDIALYMNEHFINIKVDREERPDIDASYMDAVITLTGSGGWPLSVFLTPELVPFFGGTYYPHDQFMYLAEQVATAFENNREQIEAAAADLRDILSQSPQISRESELSSEIIETLAERARQFYDERWGGFAGQMKFPTPLRWQFLLHYYRKTGNAEVSEMVKHTLDKMGSGGICDHIGGGFHRYTVDNTWLVPHFEKMLYDNAQLAALYLEASAVYDDPDYAAIARATLNFMIDDMSGVEGAFYASYDADSDGQEGAFYVWSYDELIKLAGNNDGPALAEILGVTERGNFEGKSVLTRRADIAELAKRLNRDEAEIEGLFEKYQAIMKEHRAKRAMPNLDRKIITSWNGLVISALANASGVFGDKRYLEAAERAASYIKRVHYRQDGGLYRSSYDGVAGNEGVLDDYAFMINGLVDLYQVSGKIEYLKWALKLMAYVKDNFAAGDNGYYLTHKDAGTPIGRRIELFDSVRPSGMAMALQAMLKLGALTGDIEYYEEVKRTLDSYADTLGKAGLEMAWWLDASLKYNGPFYEVIIAGDDSEQAKKLQDVYWDIFPCHAVLIKLGSKGADDAQAKLMPSVKDKAAIKGIATAYVCKFGVCNMPTSEPEELRKQLLEGWER